MFNESRIDDFFDSLDYTCRIEISKHEYDMIKLNARINGFESGKNAGFLLGKLAGEIEKSRSIACWMFNRNMSIDEISEAVGLPKDKINYLLEMGYKSFCSEDMDEILDIKKFLEDF